MRKLMGLKVGLLVVSLLTMAAGPAAAQLGDPLSLAASGVLQPFFSDPGAGFVSIFEIVSPVVPPGPLACGGAPCVNPLHAVFFSATCARDKSAQITETRKQAIALVSNSGSLGLAFNGLAAIGQSFDGISLIPLAFPIHSRVHWIDAKAGKLREIEPITLDLFDSLAAPFTPFVGGITNATNGRCSALANTATAAPFNGTTAAPFCWNPMRSATNFVTPQEGGSTGLAGSLVLVCPRNTIQGGPLGTSGIFKTSITTVGGIQVSGGFPPLNNRDASTGFPAGGTTVIAGKIFDDNEEFKKDITIPCDCLTVRALTGPTGIDSIYTTAPTVVNTSAVPVWYTELTDTTVSAGSVAFPATTMEFSYTGYWNLDVAGTPATLFHRLSAASLDNFFFGTANALGNR